MKLSAAFAVSLSALSLSATIPLALAAGAGDGHCETLVPYDYDSGEVASCNGSGSCPTTTVAHAGADGIRLSLRGTRLAGGARLRLAARDDAATVVLDATALEAGGGRSPRFDGDSVTVELLPPAGGSLRGAADGASRVRVDGVVVAGACDEVIARKLSTPACSGRNDPKLSYDVRVGRIGQCTGWLAGEDIFITAADCVGDTVSTVHFGFTDGAAPDQDQYSIDVSSCKNSGWGNWGVVCRLMANSGTKAGVAQSAKCGEPGCGWYNIGVVPDESSGRNIRITGYSTDSQQSRRQKAHVGPLVRVEADVLRYETAATPGDFGAPIVDEDTGDVIGIHTRGWCEHGERDAGWRIDVEAFRSDIDAMIDATPPAPTPAPTCDPGHSRVKVQVHTDNNPEDARWWLLEDPTDTELESGGPYNGQPNTLVVHQGYCLPDGDYTFAIVATQMDGICCSNGQGWYKIFKDGLLLKEGGEFYPNEQFKFTIDTPPAANPPVPPPAMLDPAPPAPTPPPTPAPTCGPGSSRIKVQVHTDDYPQETAWTLKDSEDMTLESSDGLYDDDEQNNTLFEHETACLPHADYTFEITDGAGDGLCCSFGEGWYKIFEDGVELKEGAEFGREDSYPFTTGTTPPANPPAPAPSTPTAAPIFFSCSQYNVAQCHVKDGCKWTGTCHNCGCRPFLVDDEEDTVVTDLNEAGS